MRKNFFFVLFYVLGCMVFNNLGMMLNSENFVDV